jgi:hypothetical protein
VSRLAYIFFLLCFWNVVAHQWDKKEITDLAVIIVPVTDVAGRSLSLLPAIKDAKSWYSAMPYAPDKGHYACMRLHQLLFNEVVRVKQILNDEAECELLTCFYHNAEGKVRRNCWVLKKNLLFLKDLLHKSELECIPLPYGRESAHISIVTLIWPWHNPKTKQTYSVGTRFVRCKKKDTKFSYAVHMFNPNTHKKELGFISKRSACLENLKKPSVKTFLDILKKWAYPSLIIPYVLGGCSIGHRYPHNNFSRSSAKVAGEDISFWKRYGHSSTPLEGMDCSGLLLRAAQIAGLPYFFKNTRALVDSLRPLKPGESLEEGDLIWYAGHVMIVSDKKKHELIEAVGYDSGYGKVHTIALNKVFENISHYHELLEAYHAQKPLRRLSATEEPYKPLDAIKLLKLKSAKVK